MGSETGFQLYEITGTYSKTTVVHCIALYCIVLYCILATHKVSRHTMTQYRDSMLYDDGILQVQCRAHCCCNSVLTLCILFVSTEGPGQKRTKTCSARGLGGFLLGVGLRSPDQSRDRFITDN